MPIITFLPSRKTIEVAAGTSLFDAAIRAGLPVASSCDAEFVCGRCNMQITSGADHLSPQQDAEIALLLKHHKPVTDRISCQTLVYGDCTVTTTYW
jgi:2Fe-2S ferredoxin